MACQADPNDTTWIQRRDQKEGGERHGRDAVAWFFIAINQHVNVELFSPERFIAQDDCVIVFGYERMRTRAGGRVYRTDWVHVFRLRAGRIVSFREYTDTATIVDALNTAPALPAPEPYRESSRSQPLKEDPR